MLAPLQETESPSPVLASSSEVTAPPPAQLSLKSEPPDRPPVSQSSPLEETPPATEPAPVRTTAPTVTTKSETKPPKESPRAKPSSPKTTGETAQEEKRRLALK